MAWILVNRTVGHDSPVENIINSDNIVRIARRSEGCSIYFVDKSDIDILDPFDEVEAILGKIRS